MPQILLLLLICAGVWTGYRLYKRESKRVAVDLERAEAELRHRTDQGAREVPTLTEDPETGVYRPTPDDGDRSR